MTRHAATAASRHASLPLDEHQGRVVFAPRLHGIGALTHERDATATLLRETGPLPVRPLTRCQCENSARPCPFVSCRHHLYLEVTDAGSIWVNRPDYDPDTLPPADSCSLDVADAGPRTLEECAQLLNMSRERVRQIQVIALRKARVRMGLWFGEDGGRGET